MRAFYPLIALAAPLALAACGDPAPTYVDQAWVRLSPNKDTPSSGYFVAHGGDADTALRGAYEDAYQRYRRLYPAIRSVTAN